MRKWFKNQKGFTLIELLVVIAILGILAAAIMPNVTGMFTKGNLAAANVEVTTLNTAIVMYQSNHNGALPSGIAALVTDKNIPKAPLGVYSIDSTDGHLTGTTAPYSGLSWDSTNLCWK